MLDDTQVSIPYSFAKRKGLVVAAEPSNGTPTVYSSPDCVPESLAEVRRVLRCPLQLVALDKVDFERVLSRVYETGDNEAGAMIADMEGELDLTRIADMLNEPEDLLESEDHAPIIKLINAILSQAVKENASDLHVEPQEQRLVVRMRVDGVLKEILESPRTFATLVVSRIKVMARLDIAEKRVPQDGRISLRIGGRSVDVRVSTLPSVHGERVVMRLLDKQAGRIDLAHLGMDEGIRKLLQDIVAKPHGMILVTGPTGSGKSTTLYAALEQINDRSRNILTVEDPVEYYIAGIGQTQVNTKVEMSFARGLRAILRQDPDVVMVGEIRDRETADIAVQAGLTGHLVLSTLHTNTASGAITRLRDMGVEPFLLSSTLLAVLAQRLVRLLCAECSESYPATPSEKAVLGKTPDDEVHLRRAKGCPVCAGTGYQGRTGIYEVIRVDNRMRGLIHDQAAEARLESAARESTPSILQDGIRKVLAGQTTLDEVLRVTRSE
jgi:general secretion pathway protein E